MSQDGGKLLYGFPPYDIYNKNSRTVHYLHNIIDHYLPLTFIITLILTYTL